MTSRPLAALEEKFAGILEMDLLRDDELVGVFSLYLDETRSRELLGKLGKLGIHTAIRRPLVAKFVALAFGNLDTEDEEFSRGGVYRRVFRDNLLKLWDAKESLEPDLERYRGTMEFLGRLGYEMVERNEVFLDEEEGKKLLPDLRNPEGGRITLPKLVASLAGHGILDQVNGHLEFTHLSFRDFFAAHHLMETGNPHTWRKKAMSVCWRDSFYFLLGLVPEDQARGFLVWLIEHRKTRWTLKIARYVPQDMSFVYFVFRCLVETPYAVDDLKDRFIQPYDGWTPFTRPGGCDWGLFLGKGPSEDYGRLFGWIGMMGTPRAVEILKKKPSTLHAEAVFGLVHIGDLDLVLDLLSKVRTFGSGPLTGREYILLALFSNSDPKVKLALNAILTGEDAEARHRFLTNLMTFTSQEGDRNPGFLVKFDPELVRNMVKVALTAETQGERRVPIACLLNSEGFPRKLPEMAEDELVKALKSEDQKIRSMALGHLHNTGSNRAKEAL